MYMCKSKLLLTKKKAVFSLCTWLLAIVLLTIFLFTDQTALLVLSGVLLLSRVKVCAAFAEAFRRSTTHPKKRLFFVLYLLLPVAEVQYLTRPCQEECAVLPFYHKLPIHSNIAIAEAITASSPYAATAEDHNGAITIKTPIGTVTVTINRADQELYMFLLSGESTIAENVILPWPWKKESNSAGTYSIECSLVHCPYATIHSLAGMVVYHINRWCMPHSKEGKY